MEETGDWVKGLEGLQQQFQQLQLQVQWFHQEQQQHVKKVTKEVLERRLISQKESEEKLDAIEMKLLGPTEENTAHKETHI